jgi:hypothetical protein
MTQNIFKKIIIIEKTRILFFMLLLLAITSSLSLLPIKSQVVCEVSVVSPQEDKYIVEEVIPIKIMVTGLSAGNVTVDVTTRWDMQWVHVPLLYLSENRTNAIYAPNPEVPPPEGETDSIDKVDLNNMGYLQLPSAPGEWWITLQVKPGLPSQTPIQREIRVIVNPRPNRLRPILLAVGLISLLGVLVILIRQRTSLYR